MNEMQLADPSTFYEALRAIIPNLPDGRSVERVVIRVGPYGQVPTMTVKMAVMEPADAGEGEKVDSATPISTGVVYKKRGEIERSARTFKIVPEGAA